MEENLKEKFTASLTASEAGNYSPLVLAFAGDAVFELLIRTMLVRRGNARLNDLNRKKNAFAKASAQSRMMGVVEPLLTEREADIYRRGRNASPASSAKNATQSDYRRATGFEALIGYLYLTGEKDRLVELVNAAVESAEPNLKGRISDGLN